MLLLSVKTSPCLCSSFLGGLHPVYIVHSCGDSSLFMLFIHVRTPPCSCCSESHTKCARLESPGRTSPCLCSSFLGGLLPVHVVLNLTPNVRDWRALALLGTDVYHLLQNGVWGTNCSPCLCLFQLPQLHNYLSSCHLKWLFTPSMYPFKWQNDEWNIFKMAPLNDPLQGPIIRPTR